MTIAITPARLHQQITLALRQLRDVRATPRRLDYALRIEISTQRLDNLLNHIACRPLALIDPELDARLRVWRQGRR